MVASEFLIAGRPCCEGAGGWTTGDQLLKGGVTGPTGPPVINWLRSVVPQ